MSSDFSFTLEDMVDFSDGSRQDGAVLREVTKNGIVTGTTAADMGYSEQQSSTLSVAAMLQGIPQYKNQDTGLQQQDYMFGDLAITGVHEGVGSFEEIVPPSVLSKAANVEPLGLDTSVDSAAAGLGAISVVGSGDFTPGSGDFTPVDGQDAAGVTIGGSNGVRGETGSADGGRAIATANNTGRRITYNQTVVQASWAPVCSTTLANITLHGGGTVQVRPLVTEAILALNSALVRYNYPARPSATGGYRCTRIAGTTKWSNHAYGIAVDINSDKNPHKNPFTSDMPAGMVASIKRIRTKEGFVVWHWGGDYSKKPDPMHFEIMCSPLDLSKGINPATVA